MKALVLSGGNGTRLRPFTHSMPKQLMPVANKPVLRRILDGIRAVGVTDIGIVVGHWQQQITEAIGDGSRSGCRITYLRQDHPRGLAHAVAVARDFLGDDDFVMHLGDTLLLDGIGDSAALFRDQRPAAHIVLHKVADPRAFGVAELGADGAVLRLAEKPEHPRSNLAMTGVYYFTPAVHTAVRAIVPGARGELEITDALQWLLDHGAQVTAGEYHGYWKDTGSIPDVLECNRKVLGGLRRHLAGDVDDASVLTGPVVIERGARVVRSTVEGPAVIASGCLVENSRIGPYTSLGRDCTLRQADLASSIVLDGAQVHHIRGLRDSLIGRWATVRPGTGDGHHRLVVGDHCLAEVGA